MAFLVNPELRAKGWQERVDGGFVRARFVAPLSPSTFRGEANPVLPLAFVLHELGQKKAGGITDRLHRYDRLPMQSVAGALVTTDKGTLPRHAVRVIPLRSPPPSIPNPDGSRTVRDPIPLDGFPAGADLIARVFAGGQLLWILYGPP